MTMMMVQFDFLAINGIRRPLTVAIESQLPNHFDYFADSANPKVMDGQTLDLHVHNQSFECTS